MVCIGIFTRNIQGWATRQLIAACRRLGHTPLPISYRRLAAHVVGGSTRVLYRDVDLVEELDVGIVRPLGRCSLDEAMFRMDLLHALEDQGVPIVNRPSAIEVALNKFRSIHVLSRAGIPVPETFVTESPSAAMSYVRGRGSRLVLKPLFGSRGMGSMLIESPDEAWRVVGELGFLHKVVYLQPFMEHGGRDVRAFIVGGRVVAAMERRAEPGEWRTNIARGARPVPVRLTGDLEELALRAVEALGCEVAGVDLLESNGSWYVLEVNSQPGWRGLQSVVSFSIAEVIVEYLAGKARR